MEVECPGPSLMQPSFGSTCAIPGVSWCCFAQKHLPPPSGHFPPSLPTQHTHMEAATEPLASLRDATYFIMVVATQHAPTLGMCFYC